MGAASTGTPTKEDNPVGKLRGAVAKAKSTRTGRLVWRTVVTIIGVAIVLLGIVLLPLPGPGWLVIFAGLGVLSTEYDWAKRLLTYARDQVGRWTNWAKQQPRIVQALVGLVGLLCLAALAVGAWYLYR